MSKPALVVFLGGLGDAEVERHVADSRWAASLDSIEAAMGSGAFQRAFLATDEDRTTPPIPGLAVDVSAEPFHFGRRLAGVMQRHDLGGVVYIGGGSVPLFRSDDLACVAEAVAGGRGITNNRYSSDLVGIPTSVRSEAVAGVARDNSLARALMDTGANVEELPRTIESLFDIDSPADLAVLELAGRGGTRLRASLAPMALDVSRYERVMPLFMDTQREIMVAGRVGSRAWQYLESETACRIRLFAEERGMEADGRAEAGTARSLLGFLLESVGPRRFFETLGELGDAAIIDSRVLVAHAGARPSREDRFLSDLGRWEEIGDDFLRDLTKAAVDAPVPVLLGGHSLMSGSLMLLNQTAWQLRDAGLL
jgi:hypothetical protein